MEKQLALVKTAIYGGYMWYSWVVLFFAEVSLTPAIRRSALCYKRFCGLRVWDHFNSFLHPIQVFIYEDTTIRGISPSHDGGNYILQKQSHDIFEETLIAECTSFP